MVRAVVDSDRHPEVPFLFLFVVELFEPVLADLAVRVLDVGVRGDRGDVDLFFRLLVRAFRLGLLLVEVALLWNENGG